MIRFLSYTLSLMLFIFISTNLSAEVNNKKKCVCNNVQYIKDKKYNCRLSEDGKKCFCKLANNQKANPLKTKKSPLPAKKVVALQNKTLNPSKKIEDSKKTEPSFKSTNPSIIVNIFEDDPIFLASITGILQSVDKNINLINISTPNENDDLVIQSYKLLKVARFWKEKSVFVSVSNNKEIDPSILVVKSKNNQFFVTQNSGVITFIKDTIGISEVRIAQRINFKSEMVNGRDVEYIIGAKLVNNPNNFNHIGVPINTNQLNTFNYTSLHSNSSDIYSFFAVDDIYNGTLFTFIPSKNFHKFNPKDDDIFRITLYDNNDIIFEKEVMYKNRPSYITAKDETIILDHKSSIGTFIAIKNIQSNAIRKFSNNNSKNKISISLVKRVKPVNTKNIDLALKEEIENKEKYTPLKQDQTKNIDSILYDENFEEKKNDNALSVKSQNVVTTNTTIEDKTIPLETKSSILKEEISPSNQLSNSMIDDDDNEIQSY